MIDFILNALFELAVWGTQSDPELWAAVKLSTFVIDRLLDDSSFGDYNRYHSHKDDLEYLLSSISRSSVKRHWWELW